MAGKTKLDQEFDKFAATLVGWFETAVEVKTDQVTSKFMNSVARRRQLARDLNSALREAQQKLSNELKTGYHGGMLRLNLNDLPWVRSFYLHPPQYQELSHRYLLRKKRKGLPTPSYFKLTGGLAQEIADRELPKIAADHIRVTRVMSGEHERTVQGKRVTFYQLRNELGQFISGKDRSKEREWKVQVLLPGALHPAYGSDGASPMDAETAFFGASAKTTIMKLTNPRGAYRPLIGPFIQWYNDNVVAPGILHNYTMRST